MTVGVTATKLNVTDILESMCKSRKTANVEQENRPCVKYHAGKMYCTVQNPQIVTL